MKSKRNFQKAFNSSSESVQLFETVLEIFVACIFIFFFFCHLEILSWLLTMLPWDYRKCY